MFDIGYRLCCLDMGLSWRLWLSAGLTGYTGFWFFSLGLTVCIKVYAGSKLGLASSVTLAFLCVYVTGLEFRGLV